MHLLFYFLEYMEENKFDTLWGRGIFTIKSMSCCQMFRNKCVSITANGLDRNGYELVRGYEQYCTYLHIFSLLLLDAIICFSTRLTFQKAFAASNNIVWSCGFSIVQNEFDIPSKSSFIQFPIKPNEQLNINTWYHIYYLIRICIWWNDINPIDSCPKRTIKCHIKESIYC